MQYIYIYGLYLIYMFSPFRILYEEEHSLITDYLIRIMYRSRCDMIHVIRISIRKFIYV